MNQKLKYQIEQINAATIPAGYKKTKIGIVPEEWLECRFKDMFSRLKRKNNEGNTNVLTISAQFGLINQEDFFKKEVASEDKSNYYLLYKGDFAYNKSYSNGYPFGAFKALERYEKGVVSPLYICFTPTKYNYCPAFYVHYFENGMMNREIQSIAQEGARNHGLLNIGIDDFFHTYLLCPPLPEQQKIAEILSTQDKLIELKQKLIDSKKQQKKWLVQNLVTGAIRLDGFKNDWKITSLKQVLRERKTYAQKGAGYSHVTLSIEGIYAKSERYDREHLVKSEDKEYKITLFNDICYNPANLKFGVICRNKFGEAIFSPIYVTFEVIGDNDVDFIAFYLMRWNFIHAVRKYEEGTVYERMAVKPEDFLKFKLRLPPLPEQEKIAEILSQRDKEIELLEKELELEKQKKKALMQLLLTGKVRVKT